MDESNKTVLRPRPGGRAPSRTPGAATPSASASEPRVAIAGSGLNVLVDAATALFSLVGQLRQMPTHPDVEGLRQNVVQQMQSFDRAARTAGAPPESVVAARYSLCTLVDETVMSNPWGAQWSQRSVLSTFHNEVSGGEKFFQILERAGREPARNLPLLEFMFVCIALGLEGRYRVLEGGRARLEQVRDNLYQTIRQQRGDYERDLSPRWRGVEDKRNALTRYVPLWVVGALAGVLLVGAYFGFGYSLTGASDPVFQSLGHIGIAPLAARLPPPPPPEPVQRTLTLREVLAEDIRSGRLIVDELAEGTRVLIRGEGLFASASATVSDEVVPVLHRIGDALDQFPGKVLVTGHTDNTPLSLGMKVRFPSNWHLSQARAESVAKLLSQDLKDPARLLPKGRGDTEPIAANDTREGRALNRRVEITLISPTGVP